MLDNKNLFSVMLLTFLIFNTEAQERTNRQLPKIGQQIGRLSSAKGWLYNPEGQWISRQNRIPAYLEYQSKSLLDYEMHGLGVDNFISFELSAIKIKDSTYYIIIKKFKDGYYKYSAIHEGWTPNISCRYFVFSKSETEKIAKLSLDTSGYVEFKSTLTNSLLYLSSESDIHTNVERSVAKEWEADNILTQNVSLIMQIRPLKKKGLIQFVIFDSQNGLPRLDALSYRELHDDYYTDKLLDYCYYETTIGIFRAFWGIK